ncbi:MAG: UbiA prenyltransferase family protein [Acidobacteria bacterium]|nr:UbiA prenyltransferase family protein [Acidobacteriota bacterium]
MTPTLAAKVRSYVDIARVDHWFKNVFVLPGMVAAFLLEPRTRTISAVFPALEGLLAVCLVASSNYVINEILDAHTDRFHPSKKSRPLVSGTVKVPLAYAEWLILAAAGFVLGAALPGGFLLSLVSLWVMGLVYNVPPVRTKELPYLDVLSEAINNPIRLLLGWYAVGATSFPPSSFLISYWLIGAYLMTAKRLSEYRSIGDSETAGLYRSSFRHYSEPILAAAMLSYASGFMFFFGVLMVKYHIEYILAFPLILVYIAYYSHLTYLHDSVAQNPEKLYRDKRLMLLTLALAATVWVLSYVQIPQLGSMLGVETGGW